MIADQHRRQALPSAAKRRQIAAKRRQIAGSLQQHYSMAKEQAEGRR